VRSIALDRAHVATPQAFKWSLFWWDAWRGRPAAWLHLTEAERDFVVARARLRGWFNLYVGAHHDPKTIVPEEFPSPRLPIDRLPRITIVTPSFQQGSFIEDTIRSVLDQRGVHIDYIVQDGGSTDGSVDVIRRHAARLAYWETGNDSGQAAAVIRGFSRSANGPNDVMMYLNSDDILMTGAVRFVAEFFAQHPRVDVAYGHRIFIDETGAEIGRWLTPRPSFIDLRMHDFIPQETLFWRRRIWDRVGGLDSSFAFALDWDLLLRFQAAGAQFARLPWFLAAFRVHPGQKTNRLKDVRVAEMDTLRRRALGRSATDDELHLAMRSAQFDSALVCALWRREWRV
jgi:glycosyltransferase involved in cell wall biosynthesis